MFSVLRRRGGIREYVAHLERGYKKMRGRFETWIEYQCVK